MIKANGHLIEFQTFPNKEVRLDVSENILKSVDDNEITKISYKYDGDGSIWELFIVLDYFQSNKIPIELFITYLPYSRMDRVEDKRTAFTLKTLSKLFNQSFFQFWNNIKVLDPHSEEYLMFENMEEDRFILNDFHNAALSELVFIEDQDWIMFPDKGALDRYIDNFPNAKNILVGNKKRNFETGRIESIEVDVYQQHGHPNSFSDVLIIDDLCSYGSTFVGAKKAVDSKIKYYNIHLIVTHAETEPLLNGNVLPEFKNVITTNSLFDNSEFLELGSKNEHKNSEYLHKVQTYQVF